MDLSTVARILKLIKDTSASSTKQHYLRKFANVEGLKEVLKFIYDPSFTTGLKRAKIARVEPIRALRPSAEEIMQHLQACTTGSDYDAAFAASFIYDQVDPAAQWLAEGLVTKDLQIGVSVTTLQNIYGKDFIPKIGIMRGMHCPEDVSGIYIASEKIDGNRRLIMTKPTGVEIYTRSGKRDYGLVEIEEQAKQLPKGYVYDTECIAVGEFADNIAIRQASASILNSKGKRTGVKACVFDMLPFADYFNCICAISAYKRKAMIAKVLTDPASLFIIANGLEFNLFEELCEEMEHIPSIDAKLPNIMALPVLGWVHDYKEALEIAQPIWDTGGEGIMLVEYTSPYEVNPNPRKTLLKVKAVAEYTLQCIGIEEGTNKYEGMLGAIWVNYKASDGNLYAFKVGSGFTDYLRDYYGANPTEIIGHMVEIEAFGESKNKAGEYALSCPIYKRVVGDDE